MLRARDVPSEKPGVSLLVLIKSALRFRSSDQLLLEDIAIGSDGEPIRADDSDNSLIHTLTWFLCLVYAVLAVFIVYQAIRIGRAI